MTVAIRTRSMNADKILEVAALDLSGTLEEILERVGDICRQGQGFARRGAFCEELAQVNKRRKN